MRAQAAFLEGDSAPKARGFGDALNSEGAFFVLWDCAGGSGKSLKTWGWGVTGVPDFPPNTGPDITNANAALFSFSSASGVGASPKAIPVLCTRRGCPQRSES